MDSRIPPMLHPLLSDYQQLLGGELPSLVTGLYLHGSLALDAFNQDLSDIDYVAFISRDASAQDLKRLHFIHTTIATRYPRWLLEGSYLPWRDLGRLEEEITPSVTYHDGKLVANNKFDVNSVTWWVLKQHGIALIGPQPQELAFGVDWDLLVIRMKENLNSYWGQYIRNPRRIAWLLSDYGVQWTVLGTLRQYYTFVAQDITSKTGAGEYALTHLPAQWHAIISEAIRLRTQKGSSLYRGKISRAAATYKFLRYIIAYCNSLPQ
jgi:hypothetical protein